ncbi:peptidylprolyl isomerase [Hyphomicrobiales bacterium]|nr:peptidylprolyl isomerase [Hyphomicrobiales bacterium]
MSSKINPYILKKESFFIENFFRDYYSVKWETSDTTIKTITYSFPNEKIKTTTNGETRDLTRNFSDAEKLLINNSIKAWDDAIDKIQFKLVNDDLDANITFGLTYIDGSGGTADIWSAGLNSGLLSYAIIEIEAEDISSENSLFQKIIHSIGNVLGFGDIEATNSLISVMEIPNSGAYSENFTLSDYDVAMIKTLYSESSFLSKEINNLNPILTQYDNSENIAIMEVTNGDAIGQVKIEFLPDFAPNHVNQIKELIDSNFYDGLTFHRVIDGFMAQTGDPRGNGTGGSSLPNIEAEFSYVSYEKGTVGMARSSDPNSANSQFFITFEAQPSLDNEYSVFGKVIAGMEYIDALQRGEPPSSPDLIISMNISEFNQYGALNYSNGSDIITLTAGHSTYRGLGGDDTYFISHLLKENKKTSITDTDGNNTIQIPSNTYIDKAIFTKNAAQLTLENGREITINAANQFVYNLSGNVSSGETGVDLSYTDFASIFGVDNILSSTGVQDATIVDMYIM